MIVLGWFHSNPRISVGFFVAIGMLVLLCGLPRANRFCLPWRWRIGILYIGIGLIFWPTFYFFFGHLDLEMIWIPVWLVTFATFGIGIKRLLWANTFAPGGSQANPYDLGWILRPHGPTGSTDGVIQDALEDFSNPLSAPIRLWSRARRSKPKD